ncbi:MAG: TIGR02206 family membrane protein, partial [Candidatus Dormibacteraceae bacterium]
MAAAYWVPLLLVAALGGLAGLLPARFPAWPWRAVGGGVGVVLAACELSWIVVSTLVRPWSARSDLPLQLCDVGALVAAAAMFLPRLRVLSELTWYWGLGASPVAILIPQVGAGFSSYLYFQYYLEHGGMVVAGVLLAAAFHLRLTWASGLRGAAITALLAIGIGLVDLATGGNYLFLWALPSDAGPLLRLGTWPGTA